MRYTTSLLTPLLLLALVYPLDVAAVKPFNPKEVRPINSARVLRRSSIVGTRLSPRTLQKDTYFSNKEKQKNERQNEDIVTGSRNIPQQTKRPIPRKSITPLDLSNNSSPNFRRVARTRQETRRTDNSYYRPDAENKAITNRRIAIFPGVRRLKSGALQSETSAARRLRRREEQKEAFRSGKSLPSSDAAEEGTTSESTQ